MEELQLTERKQVQSFSMFQGDDAALFRAMQLKQGKIQLTDRTIGERMIKEFGKDIRYNAYWKRWIIWNGKYWEMDISEALIYEKALKTVKILYDELPYVNDFRDRMQMEKSLISSESMRRREAFVLSARRTPEMIVTPDDVDTNHWLVNLRNGTYDIMNNVFYEHRREDFITKQAHVEYDPAADCPTWKQFVCEIMGYKTELVKFLQTAAGWAITGDTTEQVMFILFGSGANGKSTFLNTIQHILGDYASAAQTQTFMAQRSDKINNDVACLRGARFVVTAEAEQGARLSEPFIKQITGNDKVTARFMFSEYFSFVPSFKLFMATNHKPVIKGTDHGIWRRIRLIPFTTKIDDDKQDKYLEQKLKAEASGILNWLIEGALRWHNEGLNAPDEVLNATEEYRFEMDVIGNFIKERCVRSPGVSIRARELFKAYEEWCDDHNEYANNERFFGLRMKEIGIEQKRLSEGRYWKNIMLKAELEQ